ncbi:MAG: ribose-phosphate diphosphokinase [Thermoplasmata archaeon]|nr:MAG: ribose-phosphate diphosphokinase [Thermoplasmata archaeon]
MIVVSGSASKSLSNTLAEETGCALANVESRRFPDFECYVRIHENLDGEEVVLVQTSYPDEKIIELFLLQDAIREFDIKNLITVVPYFGYARQDKKFNLGEPISAKTLVKHIQLSSDSLITVDIHEESVLEISEKPTKNISSMPQIGAYLKNLAPDIIIAPDEGALELAKIAAEFTGCKWDYLEKIRIDGETVEMKAKNVSVSGKKVAIVDDIIATGGTIVKATEQLKSQGADEVYAACTHGLFAKNALPRLKSVCDKVISTDTIENETSVVSVAKELAKALGY